MAGGSHVIVHHGGSFVIHPTLKYVGGKVSIFSGVPKPISLPYIQEKIRSLGYSNIDKIQFLNGGKDIGAGYMRLLSDQSSVDHLNAIVEEELEVHLFCEHDWEINDAELNTSTPFLSLLGSVVQDHDEGELDLWTVRSDTDDELSDDDDEEIHNARKKLAIFREEDELFEKERSKLSRNVNANWDCGKESDGQLSEYGDSSDPESLIESRHDEDDNGSEEWPRSSGPAIYAPSSKRPIACRPTKKRKREAGETKSQNTQPDKLSRKGTPIRCSKCGQLGHNRSRCNASCTPNISQRKGKHVTSSDISKNIGEQSAATSKQTIRNKENRTEAISKKTQTSSLACTPMHNRGVGLYTYPNGYQVFGNIFATKASTPEVTANFHIRNQSSSREEVNLAGHKNSLSRQLLR